MRQDMHDYERMHSSNPNKCYDWLRSRVVAVIELYRISRNQNNLKNESQRVARPARVMATYDKSSGGALRLDLPTLPRLSFLPSCSVSGGLERLRLPSMLPQ